MSVYAVRCFTGEEIETKEMLKYVLKQQKSNIVKAIYAFETFTQKFKGENTATKVLKSAVPGYIFVETNDHYPFMRKDLFHLIKQIPKVCEVFRYKIPDDEMEQFFETCDVEPDIEVQYSNKVETEEQKIKAEQEELHEANVKGRANQQTSSESTVNIVHKVKEYAKSKDSLKRIVNRCKAFVRRQKETFIFPFSLFHKTRDRIDPNQQMSVKELTDGDFIIPEIVKTLKMEVALE